MVITELTDGLSHINIKLIMPTQTVQRIVAHIKQEWRNKSLPVEYVALIKAALQSSASSRSTRYACSPDDVTQLLNTCPELLLRPCLPVDVCNIVGIDMGGSKIVLHVKGKGDYSFSRELINCMYDYLFRCRHRCWILNSCMYIGGYGSVCLISNYGTIVYRGSTSCYASVVKKMLWLIHLSFRDPDVRRSLRHCQRVVEDSWVKGATTMHHEKMIAKAMEEILHLPEI